MIPQHIVTMSPAPMQSIAQPNNRVLFAESPTYDLRNAYTIEELRGSLQDFVAWAQGAPGLRRVLGLMALLGLPSWLLREEGVYERVRPYADDFTAGEQNVMWGILMRVQGVSLSSVPEPHVLSNTAQLGSISAGTIVGGLVCATGVGMSSVKNGSLDTEGAKKCLNTFGKNVMSDIDRERQRQREERDGKNSQGAVQDIDKDFGAAASGETAPTGPTRPTTPTRSSTQTTTRIVRQNNGGSNNNMLLFLGLGFLMMQQQKKG